MVSQPPIAILVTFGREMIQAQGGLRPFIRLFRYCMAQDDWTWLHKCKNRPKFDVPWVYVIIENRIRYRVNFVTYETRPETIHKADGSTRVIEWPRLVLAGPIIEAPFKIERRGFQGFRYITDQIF